MKWKIENGKWKIIAFLFCILHFAFSIACSVPVLETPECTAARQTVKELYSFHFGNDMKFTRENLTEREKFLSRGLVETLAGKDESATDYFTQTDDYPKAFRVGECRTVEAKKHLDFDVVLFWKTDTRSEQREIPVEVVNENGKWAVNRVGN